MCDRISSYLSRSWFETNLFDDIRCLRRYRVAASDDQGRDINIRKALIHHRHRAPNFDKHRFVIIRAGFQVSKQRAPHIKSRIKSIFRTTIVINMKNKMLKTIIFHNY